MSGNSLTSSGIVVGVHERLIYWYYDIRSCCNLVTNRVKYNVMCFKMFKKRTWFALSHTKSCVYCSDDSAVGSGAVVRAAACLESRRSRVRTPLWPSKFQRNKMFLPRSLVNIKYCGEPHWPRGSVLGLRPPGFEFRILCLKGIVISFIPPSSGGSPDPI